MRVSIKVGSLVQHETHVEIERLWYSEGIDEIGGNYEKYVEKLSVMR